MKLLVAVGVLSSLIASFTMLAFPQQKSVTSSKIDADVKAALGRFEIPGAAVIVIKDGKVSLENAYGLRDVKHQQAVDTATLFEIGSITKQFTAASILQLQDAGKLHIDDLLSVYIPDAPHAKELTLRQLLTHTSGLHDYLDGPDGQVDPLSRLPISYDDLISRVASLTLDFPPGSRWSYSNTNYFLLGKVIEVVSGHSYRAYLQHHILDPLHMKHTYTTADEPRLSDMAIGYRRHHGKLEPAPMIDPSWGWAAGFLVTNLQDLARWDVALRSGKVMSSAGYEQMTTAQMTKSGSADYGLGLFVDSAYGQPRIGHTGGSPGFTSANEYFSAQRTWIIAFTNSGATNPEAGEMLTNIVFADLYPELASNAEKSASGENATVTNTVREAFRELQIGGSYVHFNARLQEKFAGDSGTKFVANLSSYGKTTAEVFKGTRRVGDDTWHDYMLQFGPGVFIPFAVRLDKEGKVAGFSIG